MKYASFVILETNCVAAAAPAPAAATAAAAAAVRPQSSLCEYKSSFKVLTFTKAEWGLSQGYRFFWRLRLFLCLINNCRYYFKNCM